MVRSGDINAAGGIAVGGATTVFAEGLPVMLPAQTVTPHGCCGARGCDIHCFAVTVGGSSTVFVEGRPVITTIDIDSCGHKRQTFAPTVFVGI